MTLHIRPGTVSDMPSVHALMYELAVYEKSPEAVKTTPEQYAKDLEQGLFETLVAEKDSKVVGMMLYYTAYSSWKGKMLYLDDFVVSEACRRDGVGQQLFDALLEEGRRRGCSLIKWQVLDWNTPAIDFYIKNAATIERDWWNGKIFL